VKTVTWQRFNDTIICQPAAKCLRIFSLPDSVQKHSDPMGDGINGVRRNGINGVRRISLTRPAVGLAEFSTAGYQNRGKLPEDRLNH
jgi:hypothetical protein